MKQEIKRSVRLVSPKPRECLSESDLFRENLQHYSKITWPLAQGQYKGGRAARSRALR